MKKLRRKLGHSAEEPRYIFDQPRVGYRMERLKMEVDREPVFPTKEGAVRTPSEIPNDHATEPRLGRRRRM